MRRALFAAVLLLTACRQDMYDRPSRRALGSSAFFPDRSASRPLVAGTVPRGVAQTAQTLSSVSPRRGQERFEIYCAPCHGRDGKGNGVIVQHGFPAPPSYFTPEMMSMPPEQFVRTIADGHRAMYSYAERVPESDRWAIAAYIRTMQQEQRR